MSFCSLSLSNQGTKSYINARTKGSPFFQFSLEEEEAWKYW
jgi:hypothetical protein